MDEEKVTAAIAEHGVRLKSAEHRIADLEDYQKKQNDLIISVNKLADSMERMCTEQKEQGERLKALEERPARQWSDARRALFNAFLGAIGAAVAGGVVYCVSQIIGGI